MRRFKWAARTLAVTVAACLLCFTLAEAEKPDKPGGGGGDGGGNNPPAGEIYFLHDYNHKVMNPDGSGKTALSLGGYWGSPFEPSDATHGNGRWFLFTPAGALAAMKDDGTFILLNAPGDDGDWEVWNDGRVRWVFDFEAGAAGFEGIDGLVSWHAFRRDVDGTIIDSAVCVAPVLFDSQSGDVSGIDLTSVVRFYGIPNDYDWSPDGTEIVFSERSASQRGKLSIYDTFDDSVTPLTAVNNGIDPVWSPDGNSIAFADRGDRIDHILTIQLDTMTQTTLATARRRTALEGTYLYTPQWSPQSSHVLFVKGNTKGYKEEYHIWRVGADGQQAVNLTNDLESSPPGVWILGWR